MPDGTVEFEELAIRVSFECLARPLMGCCPWEVVFMEYRRASSARAKRVSHLCSPFHFFQNLFQPTLAEC
jgi:hypothetical protein